MESLSNIIGNKTVGIVGVGKWGTHLVQTLTPHSPHPILQSDPARAAVEQNFPHVPLIELTERADILILSTPLDTIVGILLEIRDKIRQGQIILDIASSKRGFADLLKEINKEGRAIVGSIHPMTGAPPNPPSLRGQNGIICQISDQSNEAELIGEAFFSSQGMTIQRMRIEEHDRLMDLIQGKPHFFQVAACVAMGDGLKDGRPVDDLERLGSPNSELFMLSVGRGAILDADLQANLITSMVASSEGVSDIERIIASMQKILSIAKQDATRPTSERELSTFITKARSKLDPDKKWRERMKDKTNTIIVRLGNIRKKSLHLTARADRIGLLEEICAVLRHHGIDLNAIDSLPSKSFPNGMEFELGHKDTILVNIPQLIKDLDHIDVLLAVANTKK